ncbi:MAG: MBL fold metallo-hydrolase [Anaerolineae bacterium]|jgi:glyoxylase-like metal-dependent hydrolase (beta-lactamase superfamily II)
MLRERVSDDVYVFTSERYAKVTAGAVVTPRGVVVIDTLPLPLESREMAWFISRCCPAGVRYVVLTHYHADHTYGAYLYPEARVVAHTRCRELLATRGQEGLERAKEEAPELEEVVLRLPTLTLDEGEMDLRIGDKTLRLLWTPGHADDVTSVFVEEDRVLFASDTVMPVPAIVDGDVETLKGSLQRLRELEPDSIVQGHGEVILRGEVQAVIDRNIAYLERIQGLVEGAVGEGRQVESLAEIDIEECGLSRVALDGQAQQLHEANLLALHDRIGRRSG